MNAVFYRQRTHKNVFNVMLDEVTQLKADRIEHAQKTTSQLEAFSRQVHDMQLTMGSQGALVDNFQTQLEKTREAIEGTKNGLESIINKMQDNQTSSHTSLNGMFKDLAKKHLDVEKGYEAYDKRLNACDVMDKALNERTKEHSLLVKELRLEVKSLGEVKQDKNNFQEQQMRIKNQFDIVNRDIDENKNGI